jgi:ubiquitin-protein ligase
MDVPNDSGATKIIVSKRLTRDLSALIAEGPANGIYIKCVVPDDPRKLRMMLVGPHGPYENCLFFFDIDFPTPYPINSPHVTHQCLYSIRCHPNLYHGPAAKVCLSILGTWAGPPWTPMMSLNTIAQTILSILDDTPLRNEPGYVNSSLEQIQPYTDYVQYVCLKESCVLYNHALKGTIVDAMPAFADFRDEILQVLAAKKDRINEQITSLMKLHEGQFVKPGKFYGNTSYANAIYRLEPL